LARLLALATQKFIADIAADAYQYSRIRSSNSSNANNPMGNLELLQASLFLVNLPRRLAARNSKAEVVH
jgi:hypothetical protein